MLSTILLTLTVYMGLEAILLFLVYRKFQKSPFFYKQSLLRFLGVSQEIESLQNELSRTFLQVEELEEELAKTTKRTKRIRTILIRRGIMTKGTTKCLFPNSRTGSGQS
jgi:hypothetical protein